MLLFSFLLTKFASKYNIVAKCFESEKGVFYLDFKVKEVAKYIETSTQYIYQQIPNMIEKGLAYRDSDGRPFINSSGLNYLKDRRSRTMQGKESKVIIEAENNCNINKNENLQTSKESIANPFKILYEETKKRCDEQAKEIEYWKSLYEEKDKILMSITSQYLLEGNVEKEKKISNKKSLFSKFFK